METTNRIRTDRPTGETQGAAFTVYTSPRYGQRLFFHFASSEIRALPYAALVEPIWRPTGAIELSFVGHRVTLTGRNLRELYFAIANDQAAEIYERHDYHDMTPTDPIEQRYAKAAPFVERIAIEEI